MRWSALVLAAGAARRFGAAKLLAPFSGAPLIRRTAQGVCAASFAEVLVVTGAQTAQITAALEGLECRILAAPDWQEGMAASLRAGLGQVAPESRGVCIFLGDMPLVPVHLCGELAARAEAAGYAARPQVAGKSGHPAAFTRAAFADLMALQGDQGAGRLLAARSTGVAYLETAEAGALLDVDTPDDLAAAARAWKARAISATSDRAISRGALPKPSSPMGA